MSAVGDSSVVIATVALATGFTVVKNIQEGHPSMRPVLGGMILGVFLLFIQMFNGDVAKALSLLILATAALVNGSVVFKVAEKVAG